MPGLRTRAGRSQPLALTAGEVGAALADRGVEAVGQRLDEVAPLGHLNAAHISSSVASGLLAGCCARSR